MLRHPIRYLLAALGLVVAGCTDLDTPLSPSTSAGRASVTNEDEKKPDGSHRVSPYPGGFSGNGSIHALMPIASLFGRRWFRHYRWASPPNGTLRVGNFRCWSTADAQIALQQALRSIERHPDGGVTFHLDLPVWPREHPDFDRLDVQLSPRAGEALTVQQG